MSKGKASRMKALGDFQTPDSAPQSKSSDKHRPNVADSFSDSLPVSNFKCLTLSLSHPKRSGVFVRLYTLSVVHPNASSNFKTKTVKIKTLSKEHSEKQQNSSETNNKLIAGRLQ